MLTPIVNASRGSGSLLRLMGAAPAFRSSGLQGAVVPVLRGSMMRMSRSIQTQPLTPRQNLALLNEQREKRPNSPHMTIYQPQLTWYLSILNRITGAGFSVLLYAGAIAYLFHGLIPGISGEGLVELVQGIPPAVKTGLKFIIALPFMFHNLNGLRHLGWDMGKALSLKGVYATGYAVLGATVVSSAALALI